MLHLEPHSARDCSSIDYRDSQPLFLECFVHGILFVKNVYDLGKISRLYCMSRCLPICTSLDHNIMEVLVQIHFSACLMMCMQFGMTQHAIIFVSSPILLFQLSIYPIVFQLFLSTHVLTSSQLLKLYNIPLQIELAVISCIVWSYLPKLDVVAGSIRRVD